MWFYKESCSYNKGFQGLCGSTKNNTGTNIDFRGFQGLRDFIKNHTVTNRDSGVFAVLQRLILVQLEAPVSIWLYKESYWYK